MNTKQFRAHPWHGISHGEGSPAIVNVYVEIVPSDTIKYELDKSTGILKVDRPQKYSNHCPASYGFIPQTYCGDSVAQACMTACKRSGLKGDGDPLDICVLTERVIPRGDILLRARPIGGLRMIDRSEVDDKIVAVLVEDAMFGAFTEITDCPKPWIDRLRHYFLTYKEIPGEGPRTVEIAEVYGAEVARGVITRSIQDYKTLLN